MEAIENLSTGHNEKGNNGISNAVVVDALPYIDLGYDEPGVREAALALVEEETRRYRPTKNYLEQVIMDKNNHKLEIAGKLYIWLGFCQIDYIMKFSFNCCRYCLHNLSN